MISARTVNQMAPIQRLTNIMCGELYTMSDDTKTCVLDIPVWESVQSYNTHSMKVLNGLTAHAHESWIEPLKKFNINVVDISKKADFTITSSNIEFAQNNILFKTQKDQFDQDAYEEIISSLLQNTIPSHTIKKPIPILIVEDKNSELEFMLNQLGYNKVDHKSNGQAALEMMKLYEYKLIFVDDMIPIMGHEEFISKAKEISQAKFIVISAQQRMDINQLKLLLT
jgi:hypothetical protein